MVYRISWREALIVFFVPMNMAFVLITIGIPILLSILLLFQLVVEAIIPIAILLATMLYVTLSNTGDGWRLDDNNLEIKSGSVLRVITIHSMEVELVEANSSWRPVLRTNGFGAPGLSTGYFTLQNGISAIVFRHLCNDRMLVLLSNNQYYIISHPGIEHLYNRIVQLGAKEKGFA